MVDFIMTPSIVTRNNSTGGSNRAAYKVEELLALRASASESAVSLDKFGKEDVIKEHVLRPSSSFNLKDPSGAGSQKPVKDHPLPISKALAGVDKKASPTPSMRRGKADRLLKEHGSPPGLRVTAGGRIVPAHFAPLANPFQYPSRGIKLTNGDYSGESDNTARTFSNGDPSGMNPPTEVPMYNGFQSTNSGIPIFNPMQSFGGIWPGYGYSFPWLAPISGQFGNPYSYSVPYAPATQANVLPQPQRAQYQDLNAPEVSTGNSSPVHVSIDSHISMIEAEHARLNHEKLEFERDEIRRSATLTAADKAKNTEEKRRYVLRLDSLRRSVKELRKLKDQGFNYCDAVTLTGVSSPKRMKMSSNQYSGDGPAPSAQSTDISPPSVPDQVEHSTENKSLSSPGRRKSYAIEIKPPHDAPTSAKSKLNPTSPIYEPGKPVMITEDKSSPKTPTPAVNENGVGTRTFINTTCSGMEANYDHLSSGASPSATSSPSTTDFFPHSAPEHSSTKFRTIQLVVPPLDNGEATVVIPPTQVEFTAKPSDELARQQPVFFAGLFDEFHSMPVRAIYVNNPFYNAGRRERRFYGRFYLRDVHTNSHLFDSNDGGAPLMHPAQLRNQSVWFSIGFCYSLLEISSSGSPELFKLPGFLYGHAHGLQYLTSLRSGSLSYIATPRSRQSSVEVLPQQETHNRPEIMTSPNTSFFHREELHATLSKIAVNHSKTTSTSTQKHHTSLTSSSKQSAPLSPSAGNAISQGYQTTLMHGVDGAASKDHHPINHYVPGPASPRRVGNTHTTSPNASGAQELQESPKRSPSKQIRNLARHFRSSAATDKSATSVSNQQALDKKSNAIRDSIKRLCS